MAENVGRRGDSWFFRIDLPPGPDGKRRQRRASGFASERAARRALAQTKVDIDAGRLRHGPRRTVADLAAEWLEAVQPNRKASTFSNYGWLMRAYVVPRIGRSGWTAFRRPTFRSCTPTCASRAAGRERRCRAPRFATSIGSCTTPSTTRCDSGTSLATRPRRSTSPARTPRSERSTRRSRFAVSSLAVEGDRLQAMWYLVLATGLRTGGTCRSAMAGRGAGSGPTDRWPCARPGRPPAMRWSSTIPRAGRAGGCCTLIAGRPTCSGRHREAMAAEAELAG